MIKTLVGILAGAVVIMCAGCTPQKEIADTAGKTEISFMTSGTGTYAEETKKALEKVLLEDFPDISVSVEAYPDEQYYSVLNTRLSTGNGPDFFSVQANLAGPNAVQKLAKVGYLEPLEDVECIKAASEEETSPLSYHGHIYSLSRYSMILCTYYNKAIFEEQGLHVPENWQEFLALCDTLKERGIQPVISGNKDAFALQFGIYQIAASEVYAKNPDYNKELAQGVTCFTDTDTWDAAIRKYFTLYDKGYVQPHSLKMSDAEAVERFAAGEAAMMFSGNFRYSKLCELMDEDKELGAFPLPANEESEPLFGVISQSGGYAVYAESKNVALCKRIFQKLYGEDETESQPDNIWAPFLQLKEDNLYTINCNQGWQGDVEWALEDGLSVWIGGKSVSVNYITEQMQQAFREG